LTPTQTPEPITHVGQSRCSPSRETAAHDRLKSPLTIAEIRTLVVADLTRGTGHFNLSQGAIATAAGIGGALSTAFAGTIVVAAGYSAAFCFLAAIAGLGLVLFCICMPETLPSEVSSSAPLSAPSDQSLF